MTIPRWRQSAASPLNGLSPRRINPRRGFERMKKPPPLYRIDAARPPALPHR
jgi:hypothetical protein